MLPNLPKINNKQEADFGIEFRRWWERKRLKGTFELKDTRGKNSISFKCFEPDQQTIANLARSTKGVLVRVSVGTPGTADYIALINEPTWIVIKYPKAFYVISTEAFLFERDRSKRKSLTENRAHEIATISIPTSR